MNKFKVGQRIFSPKFGEGVIKKIDSDGDLCIEFYKENEKLHCCLGHVKDGFGAFYKHNGNSGFYDDTITPIGPYEGESIINSEYGEGVIVETDSGISKDAILVQYDVCSDDLHDGNGYTNNGRYADHTCWYYSKSNYGTVIKPINATNAPEPSEIERAIKAHVAEYHNEPATVEPLIPEGWNAGHPGNSNNVEIMLEDGTKSVGYWGKNSCWFEFREEDKAEALRDENLGGFFEHRLSKRVIAWRVSQPKPEPKQFKRGDRVVTDKGYHGTFVAYTDSKKAIFMFDEGEGHGYGWKANFEPGRYGRFWYANPENLKPES